MFNEPQRYTVTGLNAYVRNVLEADPLLADLWVTGEISNFRPYSSGHWYFTIKDANAELKCVMFRSAAQRQMLVPKDGDAVDVHGRISLYDARGDVQLYADMIQSSGETGSLYQQFEQIKARLLAEGLFDAERKRPLPAFPRRIGIVTSPDAAAFRDVQNVLRRRYPLAELVISPTLVQGPEAPAQIIRAITRLQTSGVDVLLICRGGGSIEDLWAFNDELVGRALASSSIPTVSGIGHETDTTIVDFVADVRAPTPSAAAEIAVPDQESLRLSLQSADMALRSAAQVTINARHEALARASSRLRVSSPQRAVRDSQQRVDERVARLNVALTRYRTRLGERLMSRRAALEAANPQAILARGYAIVRRAGDPTPLRHPEDAPPGTRLDISVQGGYLHARVEGEDE